MKLRNPRKHISNVSKRYLRKLATQESNVVYDSFLNTDISSCNDDEDFEYSKGDITVNSQIINTVKDC